MCIICLAYCILYLFCIFSAQSDSVMFFASDNKKLELELELSGM